MLFTAILSVSQTNLINQKGKLQDDEVMEFPRIVSSLLKKTV